MTILAHLIRPKPIQWGHDRAKTVGASEIGMCARQVWYSKQGIAPERDRNDEWGFTERGHNVEHWAVERLREAGVRIMISQFSVIKGWQSATVDLIVVLPDGERLPVDIKSFDPRKNDKRVVEPKHVLQIQQQIGLWHEEGMDGIKRGMLLYVNASDYQDIREHVVEFDRAVYESLKLRARSIMESDYPPPREGRIANDGECDLCPFRQECLGVQIEGKGSLNADQEMQLRLIQSAVLDLKHDVEDKEQQIAKMREDALTILQSANVRGLKGVVNVKRQTRSYLDEAAMREAGIDVDAYRKPGNVTEIVTWK